MQAEKLNAIDQSNQEEIYALLVEYWSLIKDKKLTELDDLSSLFIRNVSILVSEYALNSKPSETMPEFLEFLDKDGLNFKVPQLDSLAFNIAVDSKVAYFLSKNEEAWRCI